MAFAVSHQASRIGSQRSTQKAFLPSYTVPSVKARRTLSRSSLQTKAAAYICIDCGYIYDGSTPFEKLPSSYKCPACQAPKRRFKSWSGSGKNDVKSMQSRMKQLKTGGGNVATAGADGGNSAVVLVAGGAVALLVLYFALSTYYN